MGKSPTGAFIKGAWVFGFYIDGMDKQQPCILGTFGGIPEAIPWKPKNSPSPAGFQDPDLKFPFGSHIFEQDTNRLARNPKGHGIEVPESLVPPQEQMIKEGMCPKKPKYALKYYDKFDEAFVRKFAKEESSKHSCDDTEIDVNSKCGTKALKVEDKKDESCQYLLPNNHPFTVYKFINRERFIPIAKPFSDPLHRKVWHEPENPWKAQYPYNIVYEGYHDEGTTQVNNPGNNFVSEAYGYDKTIEGYDGSAKEGIYRKQNCGIGSWGVGEEWDNTPGKQRYHRFHPTGNYYEIDYDGNEVRKIYGDSFEIDMKNKSIHIKGDWNITVSGNKNELIEGDYNLQVMGDKNVDVRGNTNNHSDGDYFRHIKGKTTYLNDSDVEKRVIGDYKKTITGLDYTESVNAERRANTITRKGAESMIDEAFMDYKLKVYNGEFKICNLDSDIKTWKSTVETEINNINALTENVGTYELNINEFNENITTHTETKEEYNEYLTRYNGCIDIWNLNTVEYELFYTDIYNVEQGGTGGMCYDQGGGTLPQEPEQIDLGTVTYPEIDGIQKCLQKYKECIEKAKQSCITTLTDPRTLKPYTRFDWEKYHASIESCKKSYFKCIEANKGKICDVCNPKSGSLDWECTPCNDPECPTREKEWEFYNCKCECHEEKEEKKIDPWKECDQTKV